MRRVVSILLAAAGLGACAGRGHPTPAAAIAAGSPAGTLAQVYYWRSKPGKLDEYSRYIREVAEPIDREAQRRGAFVSVTTLLAHDTTSAWTHMRIFVLRDSAQLRSLSAALDSATIRLEPDSARRRVRGEYSATLRDRVGAVLAEVLH